jgi:hypothetical protein
MAFQWLTAILLGARQPGPLASIAFGLLTPDTQAVRRAAKLRGNRLVGSRVAGVAAAVLSEKPNAAFAKLGRIGGGESLLCHRAHPLSVLLSGKPGAVQNAFIESFNGSLRDECLNEEILDSLDDARRKLALWRYDYNNVRPHSSLGSLTPAEARRALEQSEGSAPGALARPETDDYQPQGLSL